MKHLNTDLDIDYHGIDQSFKAFGSAVVEVETFFVLMFLIFPLFYMYAIRDPCCIQTVFIPLLIPSFFFFFETAKRFKFAAEPSFSGSSFSQLFLLSSDCSSLKTYHEYICRDIKGNYSFQVT